MSDILDDKAYIEELRARIASLKAMLDEQYRITMAARALLIDWLPNEFSLRPGRAEALERRTRAFLSQPEGRRLSE